MSKQAEIQINEQIDENLPEDVERRDWNWQALSQWANRQFHLNTNDRELKKIGLGDSADGEFDRDALFNSLNERAQAALERVDFSDLDILLADDFPHRQLSGWLKYQYGLEIDPSEFAQFDEAKATKAFIKERLRAQYRDQEIKFPVSVGLTRFMGGPGAASDKEGLIQWANGRFHSSLSATELKEKQRTEIEARLLEQLVMFYAACTWFSSGLAVVGRSRCPLGLVHRWSPDTIISMPSARIATAKTQRSARARATTSRRAPTSDPASTPSITGIVRPGWMKPRCR